MPRSPAGDRALKGRAWEQIKQHWRCLALPDCQADRCLLPGVPIRYTGERGPDSLDVGHLVMRAYDSRTTWLVEDTRPEHSRCNRSAGARVGNANRGDTIHRPATAGRW